jgi:hypothetical protein
VAHGAGPAWDGVTVGESAGLAVPGDTIGVPATAGEESGEAAGVDEVPQAATRPTEQARAAAAASARAALADDVIVGVPSCGGVRGHAVMTRIPVRWLRPAGRAHIT